MKHDWKASAERVNASYAGETPDRVPCMLFLDESAGSRISGLTVREMLASPKRLAAASLDVYEYLGMDNLWLLTGPYLGPFEGLAWAKSNGKGDAFVWKDYDAPHLREGAMCQTDEDIENLQIPEHMKVGPWPTILEALVINREKTGMQPALNLSLTWSNVQMLRGSRAYMDVKRSPDLLLSLCEKIYASQWDYYEAYRKIVGEPGIVLNAQYGFNAHMLSFEDAWKFEGQFMARFCKKTGLPLYIHNCGFKPYWYETIDKLREEGVTVFGVNGSFPQDLDFWVGFRKRYPDIHIMGAAISVNAEMEHGTPADVVERVRQNIVKLGPYGRLIICPLCCMPWRIPLSNMRAVLEAVEKYGKYPMTLTE
jgi:uroporphyrinogen-III decarboxylase